MGRARGRTQASLPSVRRQANSTQATFDPFARVFGTTRGSGASSDIFAPQMTPAGRALAEKLLQRAAADGDLGPALDALDGRWSAQPQPAQKLLQDGLPPILDNLTCLRLQSQGETIASELRSCLPGLAQRGQELSAEATRSVLKSVCQSTAHSSEAALAAAADQEMKALYRETLLSSAQQIAGEQGSLLVKKLMISSGQGGLPKGFMENGVSINDLADAFRPRDWRSLFDKVLPKDLEMPLRAQGVLEVRAQSLFNQRCTAVFKRHNPERYRALQDLIKKGLGKHPTMQATEMVRERMHELDLKVEDMPARTGQSPSICRKMMSRSTRPASPGNSGRIATLESTQKFCEEIGLDWAAVYLATMPIALANPVRGNTGRVHVSRLTSVNKCLDHLQAQGAPADALTAIRDQIDNPDALDLQRTDWHQPYTRLIEFARAQQPKQLPCLEK